MSKHNNLKLASTIKLLILDVDGVLTDGGLYYGQNGETLKRFHVHDGLGIRLLQKHGIQVAVISSRQSSMVTRRLQELGIDNIFQGQENKLHAYHKLCQQLNIHASNIAYMGDDLADMQIMQQVALAIAPANAVQAIKAVAHWQTTLCGGQGAVREVCDAMLESQQQLKTL